MGKNRYKKTDIDFDKVSPRFEVNGKTFYGKEVIDKRYYWTNKEYYTYAPYRPEEQLGQEAREKLAHLEYVNPSYVFENMTCRDLEDAVFVLEGLSKQGKELPPLKIRLNYFDFSQVPEYTGAPYED